VTGRHLFVLSVLCAFLAVANGSAFLAASPPGALSATTFNNAFSAVVPAAEEPWQKIPWRASLIGVRGAAAAQGKPILLWCMVGHPLGYT